jgi:hypothetical protein
MANHPENADPASWHRYFAVENNNLGWELAALPSRTPEQAGEMLDAAHAAALHWGKGGNELNVMRARTLLAEVHALMGFGGSALALSGQVRDYFLNRDTENWELALVHAIHAHAAAAAGASDTHRESYVAAQQVMGAITDDEDRRIVMETFSQVPVPS